MTETEPTRQEFEEWAARRREKAQAEADRRSRLLNRIEAAYKDYLAALEAERSRQQAEAARSRERQESVNRSRQHLGQEKSAPQTDVTKQPALGTAPAARRSIEDERRRAAQKNAWQKELARRREIDERNRPKPTQPVTRDVEAEAQADQTFRQQRNDLFAAERQRKQQQEARHRAERDLSQRKEQERVRLINERTRPKPKSPVAANAAGVPQTLVPVVPTAQQLLRRLEDCPPEAQALYRWLLRRADKTTTARDVARAGAGGLTLMADVNATLGVLQVSGLVEQGVTPKPGRGRPTLCFKAVRLA